MRVYYRVVDNAQVLRHVGEHSAAGKKLKLFFEGAYRDGRRDTEMSSHWCMPLSEDPTEGTFGDEVAFIHSHRRQIGYSPEELFEQLGTLFELYSQSLRTNPNGQFVIFHKIKSTAPFAEWFDEEMARMGYSRLGVDLLALKERLDRRGSTISDLYNIDNLPYYALKELLSP